MTRYRWRDDESITDTENQFALYSMGEIIECLNIQNDEIEQLKQQLAEKDKEIERLVQLIKEQINKTFNAECDAVILKTNTNQRAIEELTEVQMYISDNAEYSEYDIFGREINNYIDGRIKALKGEEEC